ncbi:P1 family peptidase [Rhodothalassium salexigens]|uniref:DmpA family aminopeptidase n=1 Tax=Rhodothalassium salexigens TaxID=1086 RepID=UPI00191357C3|nr:P1 family peptidase [Rhodothalassium salexigens]
MIEAQSLDRRAGGVRVSGRLAMAGVLLALLAAGWSLAAPAARAAEARVRDRGIDIGVLATGPLNAITDVAGVRVGQVTLAAPPARNTGVTAIVPAPGNLRQRPVPAAVHVANGYGKLAGISQIRELGEIETPIVLTNTLNVAEGIAGVVRWTLDRPGNEQVRSVNAVVGETNDGFLNDIRARAVTPGHVIAAIERAAPGPVAEGAVGAGRGTVAFGFKGGIGTASRRLPETLGGWTVGVLVQANMGGILTVDGVRVGEALGRYYLRDAVAPARGSKPAPDTVPDAGPPDGPEDGAGSGDGAGSDDGADRGADRRAEGAAERAAETTAPGDNPDGSIMIVVATDAPLSARNLERLARRAVAGLARTGASLTNGSGDYVIAFATHEAVRREPVPRGSVDGVRPVAHWPNAAMSPLFQGVAEATEEAILNALFAAEPVAGHRGSVDALPVARVMELWRAAGGRSETTGEAPR